MHVYHRPSPFFCTVYLCVCESFPADIKCSCLICAVSSLHQLPVDLSSNAAVPMVLHHLQAYELVQGPLVRWSEQQMGQRPPPTAVMVHGILGSRKNMHAYAHRLVEVRSLFRANMVAMHTQAATTLCSPTPTPKASCIDLLLNQYTNAASQLFMQRFAVQCMQHASDVWHMQHLLL